MDFENKPLMEQPLSFPVRNDFTQLNLSKAAAIEGDFHNPPQDRHELG
jgi:hypothetical protein